MKKKMKIHVMALLKTGNQWIFIVLPVFVLGIFFFFITLNNVHTQTYDSERFTSAKETIRSPVTVEKEQETERRTRETVQSVEDRFNISNEVTEERVAYVEEIFDVIATLEEESLPEEDDGDNTAVTALEKVQQLKKLLSPEITDVSDDVFIQLIDLPTSAREEGRMLFISALRDSMKNGVRTENSETATSNVKQRIKYSTLHADAIEPLTQLSEFAVVENAFFDVEETMEARKEAASNVEPVLIRAGDIIVQEG